MMLVNDNSYYKTIRNSRGDILAENVTFSHYLVSFGGKATARTAMKAWELGLDIRTALTTHPHLFI